MYDDNLSALTAYGQGVNITAHNIANMSTQGFDAWSFSYGAGPTGTPQGTVEVQVTPAHSGLPEGFGQDRVTLVGTPAGAEFVPQSEASFVAPFSNTVDVGREMVNLMVAQRGFEANVATIATRAETYDAALGLVVDYRA